MKIIFRKNVLEYLKNYIEYYKKYYMNLYSETWIFWEDEIINFYIKDWNNKRKEILNLIEKKLSNNFIKYSDNIIKIKWRTKFLILKFEDLEWNRIILDLEIK